NTFAQIIGMESTDSGLGGQNIISGMVLSPSGTRMERSITIRLVTMTVGDRIAITDEKGNFSFRGVPSGDYTLTIDREKDYEPFSQRVSVIQFRGAPPQNYNVNIRLKFKNSTDVKPTVVNAELAGVPDKALAFYKKAAELGNAGDRKGAIEQLNLAIAE